MNKISLLLIFLLVLVLVAANSCKNEDMPSITKGAVSFSLDQKDRIQGGRTKETSLPAAVFVSVKDEAGNFIFENKKIGLLAFGQGYLSEALEIKVGNYTISQFLILDNSDKIIYAAPLKSSDMAAYVKLPLSIPFTVAESSTTKIVPEVVSVLPQDVPQNFGYTNFGFEVVAPQTAKLKTNVKLSVGDILYENVDAPVTISGYDVNGVKKWNEVFQYTGPSANEFTVKFGFHHYKIETDKWGAHAEKTITSSELWTSRPDGPAPFTYTLTGNVTPKKLDYYTDTYDHSGLGLPPTTKVQYEYNEAGKLNKYTVYGYNTVTNAFEEQNYSLFFYNNNRLDKIKSYLNNGTFLSAEYAYQYSADGNVSKIIESNYAAAVTSEVNITYDLINKTARAAYTYSNGGSFEYEFYLDKGNLIKDKTTKGLQVCNEGVYTYDKGINPFQSQGLTNNLLTNLSINNRVTESVNYLTCFSPSSTPESYSYEYDQSGYPTLATTTYKKGNEIGKSERRFFYK
jgi:hypothetical protein